MKLDHLQRCGRTQRLSHTVKEKNKYHILTYMWDLEKQYRLIYLQNRNRDTDVENKCMDTKLGGMDLEIGIDTYTT